MKIKRKQQIAKKWFIELQKLICNNIEELEKIYGSNKKFKNPGITNPNPIANPQDLKIFYSSDINLKYIQKMLI